MKLLLIFLLFAIPASCQTLVQSAVHGSYTPSTVHSLALPKPVVQGDFLIVFMRNCNFSTNPEQPFVDSQGSTWKDTDIYHNKWHVESAIGGPLTLTFRYANPTYCQFAIAEWSGSWVLDLISHPLYTDDVTAGTSLPIMPSQPGELIIGFGSSDCHCAFGYDPAISPGLGFQMAALTAPLYIEYQVQALPAEIAATDFHAKEVDPIITVAAFKPKPGCKV